MFFPEWNPDIVPNFAEYAAESKVNPKDSKTIKNDQVLVLPTCER